ncbi:MAG: hypothetical protein MPJ22_00710 [Pirellulales bacterium]|nr:hypothetical protein [Pirellulales bacterium]MDA8040930.1 hypothetical protein [Pirellulales bacterium]
MTVAASEIPEGIKPIMENPKLFAEAAQAAGMTAPQVQQLITSWKRGEHRNITNGIIAKLTTIAYCIVSMEGECAALRDRVAELQKAAGK